jgi:carbonic anhydrase
MLSALLFAASLIAAVSANCVYGTSIFPRREQVTVSTWGYNALKGPLNWYGLNETANHACGKGSNQSPIVIDSTVSVLSASTITNFSVVDYPRGAEFENLGTNVEVVVNGTLVDGNSNTTFKLAQFHFHTPAEHRINSEFYPMEMHWVFESDGEQRGKKFHQIRAVQRTESFLFQPNNTPWFPFWSSCARCLGAPIQS